MHLFQTVIVPFVIIFFVANSLHVMSIYNLMQTKSMKSPVIDYENGFVYNDMDVRTLRMRI